jgi:hypothetical protein
MFDGQSRLLRFGTNAEFLKAQGINAFENGVIDLDSLSGETTLGYIFGGIVANAPHTRQNPGELSAASNYVFEVVLIAVPEPAVVPVFLTASLATLLVRSRNRYKSDLKDLWSM